MLEKWFADPGAKIKKYAKTLFVIEAIAAIIAGLGMMPSDEDMFLYGLLIAVAGIAVAYISSLFMAAFGDLVQSSIDNKAVNEQILAAVKKDAE